MMTFFALFFAFQVPPNPRITFAEHIAPLLHRHCVGCHRPGQVGPFGLLTYEQARKHALSLKSVTSDRRMPPWKPSNRGVFHNERGLSDTEIALIAQWVEQGAPSGDLSKQPPLPTFPEGWRLGVPDLILEAPEYAIDADGRDEYRCFVLDPKLTEDRFVVAAEFQPGNPKVVHHLMTYLDGLGLAEKKQSTDGKPGYSSFGTGPGFPPIGDLGGWGPGALPYRHPEGTARLLPKNAKIVLELHYHRSGKPEKDRSRIGLYFAKKPIQRQVLSTVIINMKFTIPAGAANHKVEADWKVREDLDVLTIVPHMHLLGKRMRVIACLPDGTEKEMIRIDDWDFNYQEFYHYRIPFRLPKGSLVKLTAWFDNSAGNPLNPHSPPRPVSFGLQTTDEMAVAYLNLTRVE